MVSINMIKLQFVALCALLEEATNYFAQLTDIKNIAKYLISKVNKLSA
jgi:hypothetical protein